MLQRLIIIAVMLVSGVASGRSAAQDATGTVSRLQGEASGTRNGATRGLPSTPRSFSTRSFQPLSRRGWESHSPTTRG